MMIKMSRPADFQRARRRTQAACFVVLGSVLATIFALYCVFSFIGQRTIVDVDRVFGWIGDEAGRVLAGDEAVQRLERSLIRGTNTRRLLSYADDMAVIKAPRVLRTVPDPCKKPNASKAAGEDEDLMFPEDLFTDAQRRHGAIILHFLGLAYMFVALAIVCDEFFVPALDKLTVALDISSDVAGATFMAAGGSAPEFFTSVFGAFITQNNVGIGTIVGSATFNILCVLAFCTLCSTSELQLTWWPLFRDMLFYVSSLLCLVIFFLDEVIQWHEALTMFIIYIIYGVFMKNNVEIEHFVKELLGQMPDEEIPSVPTISSPVARTEATATDSEAAKPVPSLHYGALYRRSFANSLIMHEEGSVAESDEIAPIDDGPRNHLAPPGPRIQNTGRTVVVPAASSEPMRAAQPMPASCVSPGTLNGVPKQNGNSTVSTQVQTLSTNGLTSVKGAKLTPSKSEETQTGSENNDADMPVDMTWPNSFRKRVLYVILAPIMWPLFLTLPDVKNPKWQNWFPATFAGSILYIAFYSYLMVWWANTIGDTLDIPNEIMGLTILAAGTSIPDLITSVIVARQGKGDMAVSSSIGSNLFDICVGLPVPWLLVFVVRLIKGQGVGRIAVFSKGLVCSVGLLFMMLLTLVIAIVISGWKMNKIFGVVLIISYFVFCVATVFLEMDIFICPLRTATKMC